MDAKRWMPRLGAAVIALMMVAVAVAVPAAASADSVVNGQPTEVIYTDPVGAVDRVLVDRDEDAGQNPAFAFTPLQGGVALTSENGCGTNSNAILVCPLGVQRFVFDLNAGDDLVTLTSNELADPFARPSVVDGGAGNDELRGGELGDTFDGGPGNDTLVGLRGADRYSGGPDTDTLELTGASGFQVSLDGNANDGPAGDPVARVDGDVEVILGGGQGDALTGDGGAQTLRGGGGNDTITGGGGQDSLEGDAGDDTIDARDGVADLVACGADTDTVTADWNDDVEPDCENVSRSVRDDDGDGSANGVDCNDGDPAIRPGGGDVPGNGVDEDCDGADAVLDRDGDGAAAGSDCDDADPARRPGAVDVPANGIDENCSGADAARGAVDATIATEWSVFRRWTVLTKLTVRDAPAGAKLQLRCSGKGCPFKQKSVKLKQGAADLTKRFKGRKLRPGAVVEVRVTAPGMIGEVQRIRIRKRKAPKRIGLCLAPGAKKPAKCA